MSNRLQRVERSGVSGKGRNHLRPETTINCGCKHPMDVLVEAGDGYTAQPTCENQIQIETHGRAQQPAPTRRFCIHRASEIRINNADMCGRTQRPAPTKNLHPNITHANHRSQCRCETTLIDQQQKRRATHPKGKIKTNRFHPTLHLIQVESGSEMEC